MTQTIQNISPISLANVSTTPKSDTSTGDFLSVLQASLNDVNEAQIKGDKALQSIATGQVKDLHQAAIAIDKAEISMKLMLEVRNKALTAYKDILRTQL